MNSNTKHFPLNFQSGSTLSKLRNFGGGGLNSPKTPSVRHCFNLTCTMLTIYETAAIHSTLQLPPYISYIPYIFNNVHAERVTGLDRPWWFQKVDAPRFHNNRHMMVVWSTLRTFRPCPPPPRKYSWYLFLMEVESIPTTECGQKDYVTWKIPVTP